MISFARRAPRVSASMAMVVCCLALAAARDLSASSPGAPKWPSSYDVTYQLSLPYTSNLQPEMIKYQVRYVKDGPSKRTRQELYGGTNVLLSTPKMAYEVVPRVRDRVCMGFDPEEGGPDAEALPDLSGWEAAGERLATPSEAERIAGMARRRGAEHQGGAPGRGDGAPVILNLFSYSAWHGKKHVTYEFACTPSGEPVALSMRGNNAFTGAHFDDWEVAYSDYFPGEVDAAEFSVPSECEGVDVGQMRAGEAEGPASPLASYASAEGHLARFRAALPRVIFSGDGAYDGFLALFRSSRRHASPADYRRRAGIYRANLELVERHNAAPGRTYDMALDRNADMTHEEWLAAVLPRAHRRLGGAVGAREGWRTGSGESVDRRDSRERVGRRELFAHERPYAPATPLDRLPSSVDWSFRRSLEPEARVTPVKDQATCGSCWAFGATAAVEGAWFKATGERVLLAEQQVLDCSWGVDARSPWASAACDGGDAYAALEYVAAAGGLRSSAEYPYRGADGFCSGWSPLDGQGGSDDADGARRPPAATISAWTRVPHRNATALKEAVFSHGPVAVAIDASRPSFRFYSGGVYIEGECSWKPDELDHVVTLEGYGADEDGGEYWLIRNSWSSNWGDEGYIKMSVQNHGCGVVSDAVFAVVDDAEVQAVRQARLATERAPSGLAAAAVRAT